MSMFYSKLGSAVPKWPIKVTAGLGKTKKKYSNDTVTEI